MFIDDNITIVNGMRTLLTDWNIACRTARSLEEAIQHLQQSEFIPELLICDYHLSHNDNGVEVARALCDYLGHEVPVIIITGDTLTDIDCSNHFTNVDILYKPVRPEDLQATIMASLEQKCLPVTKAEQH